MREITGYYDGNTVQLLESAPKKKQKVIVTCIDDEDVLDDNTRGFPSLTSSRDTAYSFVNIFATSAITSLI